jgi:hypothetical protein
LFYAANKTLTNPTDAVRTGKKRKAERDAADASGSLYMIKCTRDSGIDEYDDDLYVDC